LVESRNKIKERMSDMQYNFSVIIPHFTCDGNVYSLRRVITSIPDQNDIQIIVVDNSLNPIPDNLFPERKNIKIIYSPNDRYAGGARNIGMENAYGKWLIFADADDYFTDDAFYFFYKYINSEADIIYFAAKGIYPETGEKSDFADIYTKLVRDYIDNPANDVNIRVSFHVPWAKMVKRKFVECGYYQYDEVIANNDDYFAMLIGYNAKEIVAINKIVYVYTVTKGSLTKRRSYKVIKSRLLVILRKNKFLRSHGLSKYQESVMYLLSQMIRFGFKSIFESFGLLFRFRQNPFIGCSHWIKTLAKMQNFLKKNKEYITTD